MQYMQYSNTFDKCFCFHCKINQTARAAGFYIPVWSKTMVSSVKNRNLLVAVKKCDLFRSMVFLMARNLKQNVKPLIREHISMKKNAGLVGDGVKKIFYNLTLISAVICWIILL